MRNFQKAEEFLLKDKYMHELIGKWGSCKIVKSPQERYFDDLAQAIIGQQLSGKAADTIYRRVLAATEKNSALLSPENILKTADETLRAAGLSWAKIKYIKNLSAKVVGGELDLNELDNRGDPSMGSEQALDLNSLHKLPDEEVITELTKVKGIGQWTAEMFLMFSLARPDIFPVDDLGIKKAMDKLFDKRLDKREILKLSLRWKPYRTVASWYLWRSLDN